MFKRLKYEKTFEEYIENNNPKLYRLAYSYVKNKEDALDIVQDGVIKAYKNLNTLKDIKLLEKWINRIIINTSLDLLRRKGKVILEDVENIKEVAKSNNNFLKESVDNLPFEVKTVIILKYFHGYTINEVGEIMEIPASKVKNLLHKGLKLLRKEIKEDSYE